MESLQLLKLLHEHFEHQVQMDSQLIAELQSHEIECGEGPFILHIA